MADERQPDETPTDDAPQADASSGAPSDEAPPAPVPEHLRPVTSTERFESVDVLRGLAVLGILVMNIYAFAMPFAAYFNPTLYGGEGIHYGTWFFTHFLFDQKFMTIFAMLFGAGLVLMSERAEARGVRFGWIYTRRMFWLFVIGAVHGYLIWFGDILANYAAAGFVVFFLRRWRPRTLIVTALVLLVVPILLSRGMGSFFKDQKAVAEAAEERLEQGETLSEEEQAAVDSWQSMMPMLFPDRDEVMRKIEIYRGDYAGIVAERAPLVFALQTMMFLMFGLWRIGGLMLLGMAFMKLGILRAGRSPSFYLRVLAAGYLLGFPLAVYSGYTLDAHGFDAFFNWDEGMLYNYVGSILVGLGHIALVMWAFRKGFFPHLQDRLAAVGRMALTNYLMHSVVMTTIFYGYGFGLHGYVERFYQMGFVLALWIVQLYLSPWWLERYRFGPVEWVWRSLTYWRRQPLRKAAI